MNLLSLTNKSNFHNSKVFFSISGYSYLVEKCLTILGKTRSKFQAQIMKVYRNYLRTYFGMFNCTWNIDVKDLYTPNYYWKITHKCLNFVGCDYIIFFPFNTFPDYLWCRIETTNFANIVSFGSFSCRRCCHLVVKDRNCFIMGSKSLIPSFYES